MPASVYVSGAHTPAPLINLIAIFTPRTIFNSWQCLIRNHKYIKNVEFRIACARLAFLPHFFFFAICSGQSSSFCSQFTSVLLQRWNTWHFNFSLPLRRFQFCRIIPPVAYGWGECVCSQRIFNYIWCSCDGVALLFALDFKLDVVRIYAQAHA